MHKKILMEKMKEAAASVLPVTVIVLAVCLLLVPVESGLMLAFLIGSAMLIAGIGLFSLGAEMSMTRIGSLIGAKMTKSRKLGVILLVSFLLGAAEMLLGGVTSVVDMYWSEAAVFDAVDRAGMRALLCASYLDTRLEAFESDLPALVEKCEGSSRIRAGLAPHAAYTCSAENLRRGMEACRRYGIPMTTHIAETLDEVRMIRERYGATPVEYLDSQGVLDGGLIAAHCVHLTDGDRRILRERGVHVAHCPTSNMKIASGVAPIERLRTEGVNCTVGTDGPSSNNDLDMWEEMRNASFLQKVTTMDPCAVPAYELLRMATVCGAAAIGHAGELGVVKEGALADLVLLSTQRPYYHPQHDVVANVAYCAKAADVDTVVVDGEVVVDGGRLSTVDLPSLYARAGAAVRRIAGEL